MTTILLLNAASSLLAALSVGGVAFWQRRRMRPSTEGALVYVTESRSPQRLSA